MVRRTKEAALETRNQILDSAARMFHAKGVGHTTLADIAAAAGVSRGAIYWHFENKATLLEAMKERVSLPLEAVNATIADRTLDDPLGALRRAVDQVLSLMLSDQRTRQVFEILLFRCEYVGDMADMLTRRRESRDQCLDAIARNMAHAVERGQLPAKLDTAAAATGLYALVDGLYANWLMAPDSFNLVATGNRLVACYLHGLGCAASVGAMPG